MKPPIFSVDGRNVLAFKTVAIAEQYIEPEDADDSAIRLYDSEGRKLSATGSFRPRQVRLSLVENEPDHIDELADALRQLLKYVGEEDWARGASFEELVDKVASNYPTE